MFPAYAVTDEMPLEDDSDYCYDEDEDISLDPSEYEADQDLAILDKASLVMQHIVLREQEKARRTGRAASSAGAAAAMQFAAKSSWSFPSCPRFAHALVDELDWIYL